MTKRGLLVVFGVLMATVASAKKPKDEDMTGHKEHAMANCPSAVREAKTTVEDRRDGVAVTVTATDPIAQEEIRRRARIQADVAMQTERGAIEHTGGGTGSGRYGFCPGMIEDTKLKVEQLPNGIRLIVQSPSEKEIKQLQKLTRERARALGQQH
jgi:TusA-related sulfurtransferase